MVVIRPADANEVAEAWRVAMHIEDKPVALILSRQALPTLDRDQVSSPPPGWPAAPMSWRTARARQTSS